MKRILTALSVLAAIIIGSLPASSASALENTCQSIPVPVTLSAIDNRPFSVAGELCWQGALTSQAVQVLTPGGTYDHSYWDWPMNPGQYSYVKAANAGGFATFNYDRIGTGNSDHPDAASVNTLSQSYVLHQIIQGLRSGSIGGHVFNKIITVGHSFGSMVTITEAATYQDIDGAIVTGLTHTPNLLHAAFFASFGPAQMDPKFANANLPLGYLTSSPGSRGPNFYYASNADPAVIALDEQLKQTATAGETATVGVGLAPLTLAINAPVLVAIGQKDQLFCEPLTLTPCDTAAQVLSREGLIYNQNACLEAYVLPNSGHDLNLHYNAPDFFSAANAWATDPTCTPAE